MAEFDPQKHMTKMKRWDKEKNAHVYDDYLEVKWRIVWFRSEHWDWGIDTTPVILSENAAIVKAVITDETGRVIATGMATVRSDNNAKWSGRDFEKAETAAIGRALAHAGYGTQFTGEDEGDFLADSPVTPRIVPNNSKPQDEHLSEEPQLKDGQVGYSKPTDIVQTVPTKKGGTMHIIAGASMFERDPLRDLGYDLDWLDEEAKPGDYQLPDTVSIVFQQVGKFKNILRIRRDSTGEVVTVREEQKAQAV